MTLKLLLLPLLFVAMENARAEPSEDVYKRFYQATETAPKLGTEAIGYHRHLLAEVRSHWHWKDHAVKLNGQVRCSIDDSGKLTSPSILHSSGNKQFDAAMFFAVTRAKNIAPVPKEVLDGKFVSFAFQSIE